VSAHEAAAPASAAAHRRRIPRLLADRHLVAAILYTVAMTAVAFFAAWPIYAGPGFTAVATVSAIAALAIALAAIWRRWPGWLTLVVAVAAFAVISMTLAAPPAALTPAGILGSARDAALGAVTGWKDLVTVDLPVGDYRNLLVPAVIVFLCGPLATVLLGRRRTISGSAAVAAAYAMTAYGLLFGRTVVSSPLQLGPLVVPAPRETLCGAAALVISLAWLAWRAMAWRRAALRRAADASGVRVSRRRSASDLRRAALAAAMVAVAVVLAAVAGPAIAQTRPREVLRSGIGPDLAISQAVSPLSDYRANFSDAAVGEELFRVQAVSGPLPDRIRIATLSSYDGAVYRVAAGSDPSGLFTRVPSRLPATGTTSTVRVEIGGLRGIWLPTFGSLEQVSFAGTDAASLADAFYYNASASAAVETAGGGLADGDAYTVAAATVAPPALASISAPGAQPQVEIPDSVKTWVQQQDAGTGGAALQTLVDRLRQRGYLSHALSVPAQGAAWVRELGSSYTFQPSASGHSLARIDALFAQLLARQSAVAGKGGAGTSLVAGIGDDEQFAVATALVAQTLGFPARVVVGARLSTAADDGATGDRLAVCTGGVCTGADITAWVEVQSATGAWVPVDVTPQHTQGVDEAVTRQRDPENPTDVRPQTAQEVIPPDPVQKDAGGTTPQKDAGADLSGLWSGLRIAGIAALALAIAFGPFLAIIAAKSARRRSRRSAPTPAVRVVGGWDEYVDAAVDHGLPTPQTETRAELAERYGTPGAATLATTSDRAVFSDAVLGADESDEFWRIVDEERRRFAASVPLWRRALAAVSLTSFTRGVLPRRRARGRAPHRTERRGRGREDGGAR